jgi:signal peptidase
MKIVSKILYFITFLLIGSIILFFILTVIPGYGGFKVLIVRSGSMQPAIKTGDIVVIQKKGNYAVGDIISFNNGYKEEMSVTHRIVGLKNNNGQAGYETKGDANNKPDGNFVPFSNVLGRSVFRVPYLGYAVEAAKQPMGFIFIIILPALYVVYDEVKNIWNEIKKMKRKKAEHA